MTPIILTATFIVQVLPSICHRLITNPYQDQQYDSVIVTSDSITIKEKKQNDTTPLKLNQIFKTQKRSFEGCSENDFACLYGNDNTNTRIVDKFLEQYTNPVEGKSDKNLADEENSRKLHWTIINSQTQQHTTHDDTKGWVTLDPVPWSTSKISKWQSNKVVPQHDIYDSNVKLPVKHFWVSGSSFHEQKPVSQWGIGSNDLITDNRPSDFPVGPYQEYKNPNRHTLQGLNYSQQENLYPSQGSFSDYHRQPVKGTPFTHLQDTHPSTYPNNGNGEWVLLSATKGYSQPGKHRWAGSKNLKTELRSHSSRNFKPLEISRYHEENLSDKLVEENSNSNRKSDDMTDSFNSTNDLKEKMLEILYTGPFKNEEPTTTVRRKVKLQVLPALENSSALQGGLLEIDSTSQTVEEAQEEEKLKNLKAIAIVKKNKLRGYKLIPASKFTGKSSNHKHIMTLAAVGAGMIPASMALLVPMALGRKKRSFSSPQSLHRFHGRENSNNESNKFF